MMSRMSTAIPVMMRPVKTPMIGATRSHFWMSREYVAVRSSLTRAVYFRNRGCLKKLESRKLAKIPNAAILFLPGIGSASHFAISMTSAMCRVSTFTVTSVAKLPQTIAGGRLTHRRFGSGMQDGGDVLRPNREFAGHRGFQLAPQHHTSTRHVVPRHVATRI